MVDLNLHAAWIGILLGFVAGAVAGLFFHRDDWLGGYASWPRRLIRLAHISFFGLALINLAFFFSVNHLKPEASMTWASWLLVAGAAILPACCYLAAWRKVFRHLFPLPVGCLVLGVVIFIYRGLLP